jgi:hypothetical protein
VNITIEVLFQPQLFSYLYKSLHGVIGIFKDTGAKEETFDIIAAIKMYSEIHYLLHLKGSTFDVIALAGDAVGAVKNAVIREQDLKKRNTAAIFGIGMADTHPGRIAKSFCGILSLASAGRTGHIVLRSIGQDTQLLLDSLIVHSGSFSAKIGNNPIKWNIS